MHVQCKAQELETLLSTKNGKSYEYLFDIMGVSFMYQLAPNGCESDQSDKGFVQFFIKCVRWQSNISHIVINFTMSCDESVDIYQE